MPWYKVQHFTNKSINEPDCRNKTGEYLMFSFHWHSRDFHNRTAANTMIADIFGINKKNKVLFHSPFIVALSWRCCHANFFKTPCNKIFRPLYTGMVFWKSFIKRKHLQSHAGFSSALPSWPEHGSQQLLKLWHHPVPIATPYLLLRCIQSFHNN